MIQRVRSDVANAGIDAVEDLHATLMAVAAGFGIELAEDQATLFNSEPRRAAIAASA